jgi:hypothetical protein
MNVAHRDKREAEIDDAASRLAFLGRRRSSQYFAQAADAFADFLFVHA